jgi:Asp-tRNA(Asn)/Glu-tRNA(Gln) amidotransferase A subunit family amidase
LAEADKLDAHYKTSGFVGPLHGIPVLVKDEIDAGGMPTTLGTYSKKLAADMLFNELNNLKEKVRQFRN